MRWLKKLTSRVRSADSFGITPEQEDIDPRLEPLALAVFAASMEAAQAIQNGWEERTGQAELPLKSNWAIRVEELGFFLHMVNRLAFRVGGDDVRARLQDYLTMRLAGCGRIGSDLEQAGGEAVVGRCFAPGGGIRGA